LKGLGEEYVGFVFAVNSIAYFTCCLLFHKLCGKISRKFLFTFSLFSAGLTMFLFGPSILIQLPNNYWLTIVAFLLLGIIQTFFFIPLIPEMIERMQVDLNIKEGEN
jgi:MFS family permease